MKKRLLCALLALSLLTLPGCKRAPEPVEVTVFAMDTVIQLTAYDGNTGGTRAVLGGLTDRLAELDSQLSATREDSFVYAVNHAGGEWVEVPDSAVLALLHDALSLCETTGGALDITAYPAVKAWGFTGEEHQIPSDSELAELAKKIDYTAVALSDWAGERHRGGAALPQGMEMDLGAVAKGFAGDLLAGEMRDVGITSALLDLGQSTIVAVGSKPGGKPWRIGVVDPAQPGSYFAVVELEDMAMGTSGGYQRYFEEDGITYWHILDPDTAAPARSGLSSVTVLSPSALTCDGLSTALFVMGLEEGAQFWRDHPELDFEVVFVTETGEIYRTAGLEGRFSLAEGYEDREVVVLE